MAYSAIYRFSKPFVTISSTLSRKDVAASIDSPNLSIELRLAEELPTSPAASKSAALSLAWEAAFSTWEEGRTFTVLQLKSGYSSAFFASSPAVLLCSKRLFASCFSFESPEFDSLQYS